MIEVMVWLLISTSDYSHNRGTAAVIERFKTSEQCNHVLKNMPNQSSIEAKCIQANIYIKKY